MVLDLDETLIHSDINNTFVNHDKIITYKVLKNDVENEIIIPLILRPGVKQFLKKVSKIYEVILFTASQKNYADNILNYLDPENKLIKHRLYRENCITLFEIEKINIKDLRILSDRLLENIVVVDNSLYSFANQLSNGILITSFFNDKYDKELDNLASYLIEFLAKAKDVRVENEKIFKFGLTVSALAEKLR